LHDYSRQAELVAIRRAPHNVRTTFAGKRLRAMRRAALAASWRS